MISAPAIGSFVHAAHVGINQDGNMEASGTLDPSWTTIVGELRSHGVDPRIVEEGNADFVQGFLTGYKAAKANPASDDERENPFTVVDPEIE
jgi:Wiskott-Aldrich syndrome protein